MSTDRSRPRLGLVALTALSLFGALFARLWFLQIVEGDTLDEQVTSSSQREVIIPAPRGRILDTNGLVLVDNKPSTVVAVDLQAYARLSEPEQARLLERLATTLNRRREPVNALTVESITRLLNDQRFSPFRPVPIEEGISAEQEIYFREQADRFPAVVVKRQTVRTYPYGSLAAHVLGYVGPLSAEQYAERKDDGGPKPYEQSDDIGKAGVEQHYEQYLRGTPGRRVYEVDRRNRVVREMVSERREPEPGDDLHLSIDARIQYRTEEALQAQIVASETPTPAGAATVMDPRNGQVRAMASYPTYDPSALVGGVSQQDYDALTGGAKPLQNKAIQEAYPAASTFKLATSYAGLKLGIITPEMEINDTGVYDVGCSGNGPGCKKKNSGGGRGMGNITLPTALTRSSDFYYYRIGVEAWRQYQADAAPEDALQEQMEVLGYGARTGIDLTAEVSGLVPTPESNRELADSLWERDHANYDNDEAVYQDARRWRAGFSADVAIGQFSTKVTPLQTANAYASLANPDGTLFHPSVLDHVSKARRDAEVVLPYRAEAIRTVDYGTARPALLAGFNGVTHDLTPGRAGTAAGVFAGFPLEQFSVSGKTGTAEVGTPAEKRPDNSLFVGFGPMPDAHYVASVMIEGGGFGSEAAAPAVRMIFEPVADHSIETFEVPDGGGIEVGS